MGEIFNGSERCLSTPLTLNERVRAPMGHSLSVGSTPTLLIFVEPVLRIIPFLINGDIY